MPDDASMVICQSSTSAMFRRTVEKFLLAVCLPIVRGYPSEPHSVNLLSSNVLTVYEKHAGAESRLENERYLTINTLNLGCSEDLWNQSVSNTNGTLSWVVSTNGNFAFEYGLLDFRVKLPSAAATEVNFGLSSALCAQTVCSKFQRMSTGVTFYGKNLTWQNIYMVYPDPHSTNQLYVDNNQFNVEKPQLDLDGFQLIQLLWSEKFLTWKINDINVVNFTNQLALPVGDQVLDIIVTCANDTVHQPNREAVFVSSKMDYSQLPGRKCTVCRCTLRFKHIFEQVVNIGNVGSEFLDFSDRCIPELYFMLFCRGKMERKRADPDTSASNPE